MTEITVEKVKSMRGKSGFVLRGCGGNPQEWVDGINTLLIEENILLNGARIDDVRLFQTEGVTNLLYLYDGKDIDIGKLVIWRIQVGEQFNAVWLSDYIDGYLNDKDFE